VPAAGFNFAVDTNVTALNQVACFCTVLNQTGALEELA
jgi:hypothetical protein